MHDFHHHRANFRPRRTQPDAGKAKGGGVQVQQMLTGGQEVIIGAVTDQALASWSRSVLEAYWSRC